MKPSRLILVNIGRRDTAFPLTTPPLGILALAAYVRTKFDLQIRVVNQKIENYTPQELAQEAKTFNADIVGISVMTPAAYQLNSLLRLVRQALPQALIVLGGPHVCAFEEKVLDANDANVAVVGEGELSLAAILQAYENGADFSNIPGLIWRAKDGSVIKNPGQMPLVDDLDSLPMPAYDLIDVTQYWRLQSILPVPKRQYISLLSSRGCPYQCIWCHRVFGKVFRTHSPQRIVDEIEHFMKVYGVNDIEFIDDVFNLDRQRVIAVVQEVKRRNLHFNLALSNGVRIDLMSQEMVDALADINLYWCSLALESGSERLQEYIGKRLSIPAFLAGVERIAKKGIIANGFAMMGFPTETEEELQMTIDVMCKSLLHTASFFTVMPFPHTRLYEIVKERSPELLQRIVYNDACFANLKVNLSNVSDDTLYRYQRRANLKFFLNPQRIFRLLHDYPKPHLLFYYAPIFFHRVTKGLFEAS